MATQWEYYTSGDNTNAVLNSGGNWKSQTFTIGNVGTNANFQVTSIKAKVFRVTGTGGPLNASIRNIDSTGSPSGSNLCAGTMSWATITTGTSGAWYEITMSTNPTLTQSQTYALLLYETSGLGNLRANTAVGYTGGFLWSSSNSGSTWTKDTASDAMFEIWGNQIIYTASSLAIYKNSENIIKATLSATTTGSGSLQFQMSANAGSNWENCTSGVVHNFTNTGTDLRWRATGSNMYIQSVEIEY